MPKINQEEYEVLKNLDDRWKWIARNYNGALITFTSKPTKNPNLYWDSFGERMDDRLFQFIQWEDEEPYNIAELIEEYEKESEETEVKDIEWLKNYVDETETTIKSLLDGATTYNAKVSLKGSLATLKDFRGYINQLDEPEVLSQEWIDENQELQFYEANDTADYFVRSTHLQNLLVPKQEEKNGELYGKFVEIVQMSPASAHDLLNTLANLVAKQHAYGTEKQEITEEQAWEVIHGKYGDELLQNNIDYVESQGYVVIEKPTIPKFVADYIEEVKPDNSLRVAFEYIAQRKRNNHDDELAFWVEEGNSETFARAWLDGYTVEEEQKYRVIFPSVDKNSKGFNYLAKDTYHNELWVEDSRTDGLAWEERSSFTEDEIRDLDKGDILFEHFAVKVEELEEQC